MSDFSFSEIVLAEAHPDTDDFYRMLDVDLYNGLGRNHVCLSVLDSYLDLDLKVELKGATKHEVTGYEHAQTLNRKKYKTHNYTHSFILDRTDGSVELKVNGKVEWSCSWTYRNNKWRLCSDDDFTVIDDTDELNLIPSSYDKLRELQKLREEASMVTKLNAKNLFEKKGGKKKA
jgi:hypothetical protein